MEDRMKMKELANTSMPNLLGIEEGVCADIGTLKRACEALTEKDRNFSEAINRLSYEILGLSKRLRTLAEESDNIIVMDDVRLEIADLAEKLKKRADEYGEVTIDYIRNIEAYASLREDTCEKLMELREVQAVIRQKALEEASSSSNS